MKKWKGPTAEELDGMFSIDVVQQMEKTLVDELSSSINKQILNQIMGLDNRNNKRIGSINRIFSGYFLK